MKTIKLKESDIHSMVKRVLKEQSSASSSKTPEQKKVIKFLDSKLVGFENFGIDDNGAVIKAKYFDPAGKAWMTITINKNGGGGITVNEFIKNYIKKEGKRWRSKDPLQRRAPGDYKTDCDGKGKDQLGWYGNMTWSKLLPSGYKTWEAVTTSDGSIKGPTGFPYEKLHTIEQIIEMWDTMIRSGNINSFDCDVIQRMEWDKVIPARSTKPKLSLFTADEIEKWEYDKQKEKEEKGENYKTVYDK
jgi:hypothetical protein